MKIPEIGRLQPDPQHLEITFYLDPDLLWFKGHFAVQPLLPGVAQLDWVMHYAGAGLPFSQYSEREVRRPAVAGEYGHAAPCLAARTRDADL